MIITKCYVSSFGKLKDKTYEFSDGINTIKEDNGEGKTTLSFFIKCMFYGINTTSKHSIAENERKRFMPWNSNEMFGGYLEFKFNNKKFRIERFFGKKDSDDTVKLFDADSMTEYKNGAVNLGERIFGVDEEGFMATCFMAQNEFTNCESKSLISKFSDIAKNNSNGNTYFDAYSLLEEESKKYKMRGDKGLLIDIQREINRLNFELDRENEIKNTLSSTKQAISLDKQKIAELEKEINKLTGDIEVAGKSEATKIKKENFDRLKVEYQNLTNQKNNILIKLKNKPINDDEYNSLTELYSNYNQVKKNQGNKKMELKINPVYFLIPFIFVILGVVVLLYNTILGIVAMGLFAISGLSPFLLKKKNDKLNKDDELTNKATIKLKEILNFYGYLESDLPSFMFVINNIRDLSKELNNVNNKIIDINKELNEMNIEFREDFNSNIDYNKLTYELKNKQGVLALTIKDLESKKASLTMLEEKLNEIFDSESKLSLLNEKLIEESEKYNLIIKTMEYLFKANENMKVKYRIPLEESLNKYLKKITKLDIKAVIDNDMNISIEENGVLKSYEYYSRGFQDLFAIVKRFAICEVLFNNEKPFFIIDDVFYNLDESKITEAVSVLKELSKDYQIIYFVCHDSRRA